MLVLFGAATGANLGLLTVTWHMMRKARVLTETLQNDWNLRQIEGAVKQPMGYDPYRLQTATQTIPYYGSSIGSTTNKPTVTYV
jgi:hypothetical protein